MALEDAYQASTEAMLKDMAWRPAPARRQEPSFSLWATMKAAPKGVAAGAAQGVASTADVTGAFGDVLAAVGDSGSQGMFGGLTAKEREESNAARDKLIKEGVDFNTEPGRVFRDVAKDYMPDSATAHTAEKVVANLFRVGGKAVAAGTLLGPYGGAALTGAEEGFTTSDELGQQGVDLATRTKAGLAAAAFTGASFALPVAGPTWKSTLALAAAGGPASFVGQNAVTREILNNAGYDQLAAQYDPFDPVGLALSTLLPFGFGAAAMRVKGAKAGRERIAADEASAAMRPERDAVDAARVNLLRESIEATRPARADDLQAATRHDEVLGRAIDQVTQGRRVDIQDALPKAEAARVVDLLEPRLAKLADEVGPLLREADAQPMSTAIQPPPRVNAVDAARADVQPVNAEAGSKARLVSEAPEIDRAVGELEARAPDLLVQMDGQDAPVKLSELMASEREALGREVEEAGLLEIAAQCFVRSGGG